MNRTSRRFKGRQWHGMRRCLCLLCILGSAVVMAESPIDAPSPVLASLLKAAHRLETQPIDEPQDEVSLAWDYAVSRNDTGTAIVGVLALWKKHKCALVELAWWRQNDPEARKAILLLFYALSKVEADNFPDFETYASRFEATESAMRKKEIGEVKLVAQHSMSVLTRLCAPAKPKDPATP